ncbi:MAG: hypothetical protein AB8G77_13725 [Rhodothermales bacterium]
MEIKRSLFRTTFRKTLLNVASVAAGGLLLIACEDPSSVGLGLVGDDTGQPITETLGLSTFEAAPEVGIVDNLGEVLVGTVNDPTMGGTNAVGYIDIRNNNSLPEDYRTGTIERAILRLENSYVYGDTLEALTLGLHEVLTAFSGFGSTLDSIPDVGPELMQFTITPADSIVEIDLPESWITANDTALRAANFADAFHGFQLVPISGNAVVGFHNSVTRLTALRSIVGTDTVNFSADKSITTLSKFSEANVPPGRLAIQDGIGPKIAFNFNIDSLQNVSLNRFSVRLPADQDVYETPANFFRPPIEVLSLHGVLGDSASLQLAIGSLDDDGNYDFSSDIFHAVLQQFLLGAAPYDKYEIRFPSSSANSIDALVMHDVSSETAVPEIFITYTELK